MPSIFLFNKPMHVLSQFSDDQGRKTLADFLQLPGYRPAGRLDYDSEGLLLLTNSGRLQNTICASGAFCKQYLVQVEGPANPDAVSRLLQGVQLKDGPARALACEICPPPADLWPRIPPIRVRKSIPDHWLRLTLDEGRNRQVRRMTAAVGLPTLRLIREQIGPYRLDTLQPGESRSLPLPARGAGRRRDHV